MAIAVWLFKTSVIVLMGIAFWLVVPELAVPYLIDGMVDRIESR